MQQLHGAPACGEPHAARSSALLPSIRPRSRDHGVPWWLSLSRVTRQRRRILRFEHPSARYNRRKLCFEGCYSIPGTASWNKWSKAHQCENTCVISEHEVVRYGTTIPPEHRGYLGDQLGVHMHAWIPCNSTNRFPLVLLRRFQSSHSKCCSCS